MTKINHAQALAMWRDGATDETIAERFGMSRVGVEKWRARNDLKSNHTIGRPRKLDGLTHDQYRAAMSGNSINAAAAALGVSWGTLAAKAEREGWL